MTDKEYDKRIADKLQGYKATPPGDMFARIEESLVKVDAAKAPATMKRPLRWYVSRWSAAAVILFGLTLAGIYIGRSPEAVTPQVAIQTRTNMPQPAGDIHVAEPVTAEYEIAGPRIAPGSNAGNVAVVISSHLPHPGIIGSDIHEPQAHDPAVTNEPDTEKPSGTKDPTPRIITEYPPLPIIEDPWKNILAQADRKSRRNGKLSATLYGGNYGAGSGDIEHYDMQALARSDMKVTIVSEAAKKPSGNMVPDDASPRPPITKNDATEFSLQHKMPITAGLSISYPISPKVSLVSGLNYSYLYSVSREDGMLTHTKFSREIHYVGIPLAVTYNIYDRKWFNLYVRGGGMIEKAVYASTTLTISSDADAGSKPEKFKVKGVQPSVDAALGINFRVAKSLSIYAEPGVAYYFENLNQPANYRTENPTSFSLRIGLRFGL